MYNAIYLFSNKMVEIMNEANNCTNLAKAFILVNAFLNEAETLEINIPDNVMEIAFRNTGIAEYMFGECSTKNTEEGDEIHLDEIYDIIYYSLRIVAYKIVDAGFVQDTGSTSWTRGYPVFVRQQ